MAKFKLGVTVMETPGGGALVICEHVVSKWDGLVRSSSAIIELTTPENTWGGGTFNLGCCAACAPAFNAIVEAAKRQYGLSKVEPR
jgi:hypothetical protein